MGLQKSLTQEIRSLVDKRLASMSIGNGGGPTSANLVSYDNSNTGLEANNVQEAIDELYALISALLGLPTTLGSIEVGERVYFEDAGAWTIVAHDHFKDGTTTLWKGDTVDYMPYAQSTGAPIWHQSDVRTLLRGSYYNSLPDHFRNAIEEVTTHTDETYHLEQMVTLTDETIILLSAREYGIISETYEPTGPEGGSIPYFDSNESRILEGGSVGGDYYTRSGWHQINVVTINSNSGTSSFSQTGWPHYESHVVPTVNLDSSSQLSGSGTEEDPYVIGSLLSSLDAGDIFTMPDTEWTFSNYFDDPYTGDGTLELEVIAHDHFGPNTTLVATKHLIAEKIFDEESGEWGQSDINNYLNTDFLNALGFKDDILETEIQNLSSTYTQKIFLPSQVELGLGTGNLGTTDNGDPIEYFEDSSKLERKVWVNYEEQEGFYEAQNGYWTRSYDHNVSPINFVIRVNDNYEPHQIHVDPGSNYPGVWAFFNLPSDMIVKKQ